jgi:hypothetical protein
VPVAESLAGDFRIRLQASLLVILGFVAQIKISIQIFFHLKTFV